MIKFLVANSLSVLFTLLVLLSPLLLPTELAVWLPAPIVALFWFWKAWSLENKQATVAELNQSKENAERLNRAIDLYVDGLASCVNEQLFQFNDELHKLKSIVADAVGTMSGSFNNLHLLTSNQSAVVHTLVHDLDSSGQNQDGGLSFQQFAEETDKVLSFFIQHILQISKQSMEMVAVIDDVGGHMAHVEKLLGDVQKIADQTNLLALNAAIEAARAGEAGRGFAVVADEVRNLSKHSDKFSEEIKTVVNASKNNIGQAQTMIERMASKDMNVTLSSKAKIDKMMADIAVINQKVSRSITEVSHLTERVESSVNDAVRGLQFEDMSRQLIECLQKNIQHFQALNDEIAISMCVFKTSETTGWEKQLLDGVDRLRDMKNQWRINLNTVVLQSSVEEGDVELF